VLYPFYVVCGVLILYSLMIGLAASSVWLGRNQSLYNFWFYITNFSRYPMEIYDGPGRRGAIGRGLRQFFSFVIPVLLAVNIPARLMAWPLDANNWRLAAFTLLATVASLWLSRRVFYWALKSYRSASS
jgi:ABC-2 type transport system permease protein